MEARPTDFRSAPQERTGGGRWAEVEAGTRVRICTRSVLQIRGTGFDVSLIEVEPLDKAMIRTRLLLVEDDQDSLEAFSIMLGEMYAVFGYASAVEALQAIDAAKPDVLVLDIGMQRSTGFSASRRSEPSPDPAIFPPWR